MRGFFMIFLHYNPYNVNKFDTMRVRWDFGADLAANGGNSGRAAINGFDPQAIASQQQQNTNTLFNTQLGQANDFTKQYADVVAKNPTVQGLYQAGNDMFNVPGLAQNANTLNNAVLQIPQANVNRARGFDTSADQILSQTSQDLGRLQPLASAASNTAQTAQTLAGQFVQAGQAQNAQNLLPVQNEAQMVLQAQAAQATGWNNAAQSAFAGLQAKMQAGVQLSAAEMSAYSQLQSAKMSYDAALNTANASQNVAKIGAQNVVLPAGSTYLNTSNGKAYNPYTAIR